MPVYMFKCVTCKHTFDVYMSIENIQYFPEYICPTCETISKRVYTPVNINSGISSRVYYQWKGSPDTCPPDLRNTLKMQDMPKGISTFNKEGEPVLGTGNPFKGELA
jgi:putative FmdB family regulatory protein